MSWFLFLKSAGMKERKTEIIKWVLACTVNDVPENGGVCVKNGDEQIALFHFKHRGEWYASQNNCPHREQMALSRGMIGSQHGEPKIACPFHKKTFSLVDGRCLVDGETYSIKTYAVKVEQDQVYIGFSDNSDDLEEALV
jgi:nitrite reductase (NADH) small subunit